MRPPHPSFASMTGMPDGLFARECADDASWMDLIHYPLVACIKQVSRTAFPMTEITNRIREPLMTGYSLLEVLNLEPKTIGAFRGVFHMKKFS